MTDDWYGPPRWGATAPTASVPTQLSTQLSTGCRPTAGVAVDLAGEQQALDDVVVEPDDEQWQPRHAESRLERRRPDRPPVLLRRHCEAGDDRSRGLRCAPRRADVGLQRRRRGGARHARSIPGDVTGRVARQPGEAGGPPSAGASRRRRSRRQGRVVRAVDEQALVPHRAFDGGVGARPGRRRRGRWRDARPPIGCVTSPSSA